MMKRFSLLSLAAAVGLAGCASGGGSTPSAGTTAPMTAAAPASDVPALYTDQQARRGETAYDRVCLDCHTKVEFKERPFLFAWEGSSVGQVYKYIAENMPDDGPASLDEDEYLSIMAYILEMNGYPAGAEALTPDVERMGDVPFEGHGGED